MGGWRDGGSIRLGRCGGDSGSQAYGGRQADGGGQGDGGSEGEGYGRWEKPVGDRLRLIIDQDGQDG